MLNARRPWLTVVIPTHNGERWLAATLDSLAAQTQAGFTCHLIDSSATDAILKIAAAYRDRVDLRIERRPDLLEWTQKTNHGVSEAATDHVCMLHQDDIWEQGRAAAVRRWIDAAPSVAMHLHPSYIIDDRGRRLGTWRCPLPPCEAIPADVFRTRLIVQNFVAICAPVIRRDAFLSVGGLDHALWYTADWDLYLKLASMGSVAYHEEKLAAFRVHAQAQTVAGSRRAEAFRAQMTTVLEYHQGGLPHQAIACARASIEMNVALAKALHGERSPLLRALREVVMLGPAGACIFFRDTRLIERLLPRLRLGIAGRLTLAETVRDPA